MECIACHLRARMFKWFLAMVSHKLIEAWKILQMSACVLVIKAWAVNHPGPTTAQISNGRHRLGSERITSATKKSNNCLAQKSGTFPNTYACRLSQNNTRKKPQSSEEKKNSIDQLITLLIIYLLTVFINAIDPFVVAAATISSLHALPSATQTNKEQKRIENKKRQSVRVYISPLSHFGALQLPKSQSSPNACVIRGSSSFPMTQSCPENALMVRFINRIIGLQSCMPTM